MAFLNLRFSFFLLVSLVGASVFFQPVAKAQDTTAVHTTIQDTVAVVSTQDTIHVVTSAPDSIITPKTIEPTTTALKTQDAMPVIVIPTTPKEIIYTRFIEVGISANAYRGDLQAGFEKFTGGFHLGIQWLKKKRLNGAINVQSGYVSGQNIDYHYNGTVAPGDKTPNPNSYFKTSIFTVHYEVQLNLIKRRNFRLFVAQGIGLIRFNPKDQFQNALSKDLTSRADGETYSNLAFMLPTQWGFQYFLSNGVGAGFKMGWYHPQTDYIDNISKWGNKPGNDKIFVCRFTVMVPIRLKAEK
ncbi:MAG: hypothetical protein JWO58_1024 [Chitinophagaceae bacterium]|nr:hypothetical protein [Chitinophagaceae bacterium]